MARKIIHCDADCFYAAIEMRDDLTLRNRPMAVGGGSDRRGVISTCNYEARQFGVRSAMASAHALKLCPSLVIVPHRMEAYKEASRVMREVFHSYTDLVEPLSLDEAYLDVSEVTACGGSATRIAEEIRQTIKQRIGITVSAGVSNSKYLAKIASDWHKPDGLCVIRPDQVEDFVRHLPVTKIHGVGKVTAEKMKRLNIHTCSDVRTFDVLELTRHFGAFGQRLSELAQGIDHREVKTSKLRKSLSVEHTYPEDLPDARACQQRLPQLLEELTVRLSRLSEDYLVSKAFVKVKFSDFTTTTLERAGTGATMDDYVGLLEEAVLRKPLSIRLLGLGVRFDEPVAKAQQGQLELFPAGFSEVFS